MKITLLYAFGLLAVINGIHGQTIPDDKKQICTPGSETKLDCNTCTCSLDGTALGCTRMACPKIPAEFLNPDGSIKLPHQSNPLLRIKRDTSQICKPNTVRTRKCNTCRCNRDGTAEICTRRICPDLPRQRRDIDFKCEPGKYFKDDCNHCQCSSNGRSAVCTLMACSSLTDPLLNADGTIKRPHQFNPLLRAKRSVRVCQPNTSRVWECNNCRCSSDGTKEVCTRRICPIVPRHKRDIPFRCEPNTTFKQDCNTCFCSSDGTTAGCTLMSCVALNVLKNISEPRLVT